MLKTNMTKKNISIQSFFFFKKCINIRKRIPKYTCTE